MNLAKTAGGKVAAPTASDQPDEAGASPAPAAEAAEPAAEAADTDSEN